MDFFFANLHNMLNILLAYYADYITPRILTFLISKFSGKSVSQYEKHVDMLTTRLFQNLPLINKHLQLKEFTTFSQRVHGYQPQDLKLLFKWTASMNLSTGKQNILCKFLKGFSRSEHQCTVLGKCQSILKACQIARLYVYVSDRQYLQTQTGKHSLAALIHFWSTSARVNDCQCITHSCLTCYSKCL